MEFQYVIPPQKKILGIRTSHTEIIDLLKAWIAISIAFGFVIRAEGMSLLTAFLIAGLSVGVGFLFHELGHKFVAQRYRCWAEFRAQNFMLVLAMLFGWLFGFVFAAPGAVVILGHVRKDRYGKVALAGPLVNFVIALLMLPLMFSASQVIATIGFYSFMINSWLGLFNLIPFSIFDGLKILRWNKVVYGIMVAIGFLMLIAQQFITVMLSKASP